MPVFTRDSTTGIARVHLDAIDPADFSIKVRGAHALITPRPAEHAAV